eukprot:CAMPEP_0181348248 /NCGR_PEP_ID=MMETSP1106-20121128/72_1 /TAXON_ID=81844 /ORGANISM="Mantoniella antarctica, Strain SL-175" /LENGTH=206 /DNA_ID=CAMNT_0023460523 /DNA_START=30 /DNA_END=650 /DNA_ORIENTATION=+
MRGADDDDEVEAQLEAARRLNEELRRMELGESSALLYEDIYGQGGARIGHGARGGAVSPKGSPMKRTFSSAPKTIGMGRRRAPNHFSFNDNRVTEIERENRALADRLARVDTRPGSKNPTASRTVTASAADFGPAHLKVASTASSSINRKKANDQIARDNAAMLSRLNNVRPSQGLAGGARPSTVGGSRPGTWTIAGYEPSRGQSG